MVKTRTYLGKWSSEKAEAKFRAKEAVVWQRANVKPEAVDISTYFGDTRIYRWPGTGPPVVFLHGMTDTSIRWIPYGEALTDCDVYAIDIMGEVGSSTPRRPFTSADDYVTWLDETLTTLELGAPPHIVGASLGGYIAFSYAMSHPVASLTGFEPVGLVDLQLFKLMRWSMCCGLVAYGPEQFRHRRADRLRQPLLADKPSMELVLQAQRGHPIRIPPLPVFTDEELQSISSPVRVLAGADSAAFDVNELVGRVNRLIPRGEARVLPEAGHAISDSHFDDCLSTIREVIEPERTASSR